MSSLAYADDLCLIGTTKDGINHMLETTANFLKWAGFQLNPPKCGSLSMINKKKRYVESFEPDTGEGLTIPALKWEDRYKYTVPGSVPGQGKEGKPGRAGQTDDRHGREDHIVGTS